MNRKYSEIARNYGGSKRFKVYDQMGGSGKLNWDVVTDSIIKSINAQVKKTNDYLEDKNPNKKKDRCIVE